MKRQNRLSVWGAVFNLREIVPAGSLADNYLEAAEEAVAAAQLQGQLSVVNGLTNILVEGFNTSMVVMMGIPTTALTNLVNTAAGEAVLPTEFPQIPVIDYSQDVFVHEDPYWHGWSLWCAGTGITMLLPGGIAKQAGPALKGSSIGRMLTGVSKALSGAVEAVVSQAKSLTPKSLGKVRLPRSMAKPTPVAEAIAGAPAGVAPISEVVLQSARRQAWRSSFGEPSAGLGQLVRDLPKGHQA
ncbi:MAG: hypothetical protein J5I93_25630 [Pirellulaceae bacterium]|nr:hypothetical protein [Pirellulaceae bacterium]